MKLFFGYIRQQWGVLLAFGLFAVFFCTSFYFYGLPVEAALYPALLCALTGGVFFAADFYRVYHKHRELRRLQKLSAAMIGALPEPDNIAEADCQAVIMSLIEEAARLETEADAKYRDMAEYYTLWVHQIKTPITSMRLTLDKEDSPLSRKLSSDLLQIEQYVEMVLAFLRLNSESSDYVFREHSLDEIIRQAVSKFAAEFIDRRISLDYTSTEKKIVTDDKWLSLVIEQTLSNALKYTQEGKIKIYVSEPTTLVIEDTGIGIDPADLPRVFEKGYTGYNGRTDKRASGLGLYLCKRICAKLGAEISIASEQGRGTKVRINLDQYRLTRE